MADKDNVYVHRLYKVKCDQGTMSNYLNVKTDHGVVWMAPPNQENNQYHEDKLALMNACDYEPKENVVHLGRCNSPTNMGNLVDKEELIMGCLLYAAMGPVAAVGILGLKHLLGCGGCKCEPIISDAWDGVDESMLIDGVPSITEGSCLFCRNGGTITIEPVEQEQG